jgi:lipopolysaccharide heptosyltransferase II
MIRRILIINVNWVGDVLFSTPFIRAVRQAHPDAFISCLLHPRCVEMLENNPRLNEIIIYDEELRHKSIIGKLKLIALLKRRKFDTAFILHRSFTKALIARLAGVKELIGYPTKKRSFLLTKAVEEPAGEIHKVEYFLDIARAAGIKPQNASYEFFIGDKDRRAAGQFLADNGVTGQDRLVVICPGGNWDPKRWPKENFASAADEIADKHHVKILISGSARETELGREIRALMKKDAVMACGRTTLRQLAAIFERSLLVIANDTGTMHLAVAMKAATIALFGPTSPVLTGPYGDGHYKVIQKNSKCEVPCYDYSCKDNSCMKEIAVDDVVVEAERMLAA